MKRIPMLQHEINVNRNITWAACITKREEVKIIIISLVMDCSRAVDAKPEASMKIHDKR